jgi:uncharacterized membrane protein
VTAVLSALTLASAAGINAYATLLVLGVLVRYNLVPLTSSTAQFFAQDWVLVTLALLYLVEFVADKVPVVDHAWDVVHTFVRPVAGAVAAIAVVSGRGEAEGWVVIAAILGGVTSLLFHGAKATGRLASSAATGGTMNPVLSVFEDVFAFVASAFALLAPVAALGLAALALLWLLRRRRHASPC